jgi:hypothetical protein
LQGRTVNITWYLKREGALDTTESTALDYYLVLTGPRSPAVSSQGATRPWCIEAVYLFEARQLRSEQIARGVKRGVASSIIRQQWETAEIYPSATNTQLTVTPMQAEQLRLFTPRRQAAQFNETFPARAERLLLVRAVRLWSA